MSCDSPDLPDEWLAAIFEDLPDVIFVPTSNVTSCPEPHHDEHSSGSITLRLRPGSPGPPPCLDPSPHLASCATSTAPLSPTESASQLNASFPSTSSDAQSYFPGCTTMSPASLAFPAASAPVLAPTSSWESQQFPQPALSAAFNFNVPMPTLPFCNPTLTYPNNTLPFTAPNLPYSLPQLNSLNYTNPYLPQTSAPTFHPPLPPPFTEPYAATPLLAASPSSDSSTGPTPFTYPPSLPSTFHPSLPTPANPYPTFPLYQPSPYTFHNPATATLPAPSLPPLAPPSTPTSAPTPPKPPRTRPRCRHPNCTKQARNSIERGSSEFCKLHMRAQGLTPRESAIQPNCRTPGCTKKAVQSKAGGREHCVEHLRLLGQEPNCFPLCAHGDCKKKAQPSQQGRKAYCNAHMRQYGLTPRPSATPLRICEAAGCDKKVQGCMQGGRLCIHHGRQQGLTDTSVRCKEAGCTKYAFPSLEVGRAYCCAHLRAHGWTPKVRTCQHDGCNRRAAASTATGVRTLYCLRHMGQYGLTPRAAAGAAGGVDGEGAAWVKEEEGGEDWGEGEALMAELGQGPQGALMDMGLLLQ